MYCGFYCCWLVFHLTPLTFIHTVYHSAASQLTELLIQCTTGSRWKPECHWRRGRQTGQIYRPGKSHRLLRPSQAFVKTRDWDKHRYCSKFTNTRSHPHVVLGIIRHYSIFQIAVSQFYRIFSCLRKSTTSSQLLQPHTVWPFYARSK